MARIIRVPFVLIWSECGGRGQRMRIVCIIESSWFGALSCPGLGVGFLALDEEDVLPIPPAAGPGVDAGQVEPIPLEDGQGVSQRAGLTVRDGESDE